MSEPAVVPQHGIGAQYLEPVPYVATVGVPGVLSLHPLPVSVSPDQAQLQVYIVALDIIFFFNKKKKKISKLRTRSRLVYLRLNYFDYFKRLQLIIFKGIIFNFV